MTQISPPPPPEQEDISSSSTSLSTLSASHPSPSSSLSASFTQRISSTLPKKLSQFLAQSLTNPSPPQSRFNDTPPHSSTSSVASEPLISHKSPFASPIFIPASGAPGFRDDRNWDKGFDFPPTQKVGQPVMLHGRNDTTRPVLPADLVEAIRLHLPPLFRLSRSWTLLYSLDQHGISIGTFYSRLAKHEGGCLLAICDANDGRFGVWVGDGIRRSHGESYYGSGESFLWKNQNGLQVFKWTGKNDYVALCEQDYISFGGGDGKYGLFLDSAFYDGSSASCATFDNEVLCSNLAGSHSDEKKGTVRFECLGLEAWGISR
ncbi:hypothetical protein BS47DRAFT_1304131 [Hydnum rufescens UP504]|uniref:Oxidation resistance protein 1 n=1 Tax=Hydnum rufescens UP504 TaxID=1448309 RepID=A0A9P6DR86_9AGAM|nr:hypothetical protein BS47DRAFT_1304131 [Hydnum rufescens UP504]